MITQSFSIPQLLLKDITEQLLSLKSEYNDRKIIPPYEIDVYYPQFMLGFEYNGRGWHKNNKNDDFKLKLGEEKEILLIVIEERNREYEVDIKKQLCENLEKITNLNLTTDIINSIQPNDVYKNILDINDIIKKISKYQTLNSFKTENSNLYQKLSKINKLSLLSSLKKIHNTHSIDDLKNEIKKHEFLIDFIKNNRKHYLFIKRHNLSYLLSDLKRKNKLVIPL